MRRKLSFLSRIKPGKRKNRTVKKPKYVCLKCEGEDKKEHGLICKNNEKQKFIFDPTCGSRSIWFQKKQPNTIYSDIRQEKSGFIYDRPNFVINPDEIIDFKKTPFENSRFRLIVWDPPHLRNLDDKSWIKKKYGSLGPQWEHDLKKGFEELWRILADYGVLILKWSVSHDCRPNRDVPVGDLLKIIPVKPLFGHTTGKSGNTMWICFMKIPDSGVRSLNKNKRMIKGKYYLTERDPKKKRGWFDRLFG